MFHTKIMSSDIHDIYYYISPSICLMAQYFYFNSMIDIVLISNKHIKSEKKIKFDMLTKHFVVSKMKKVIYAFHPLPVKN